MLKKFIILLIALVAILSVPSLVSAKVIPSVKAAKVTAKVMPSPSPSPTPAPVDSFSLFWPMVAGKTMQSKIYILKTLKESLRGFFIFGSAQKADYDIFLGVKRMLEAEVLMKGNVPDLADKTLDSAANDLDKANSALTNAKNSGDIPQNVKDEINTRVSNLKKFATFLMHQDPTYKDKLQTILDKLNSLTV